MISEIEKGIRILKSHGFYTEAGHLEEIAKELAITRKLLQEAESHVENLTISYNELKENSEASLPD